MATRQHNERCKECKRRIFQLLKHIYGEAKEIHNPGLPAHVDGYRDTRFYDILRKIHRRLQEHRGFSRFVRAKKLPAVDYYVPRPGFIVEFDESQHFTKPRELCLRSYPAKLKLGFDKAKWIQLCEHLRRKDNDPPYRDEQRAWYDTLRDFGAVLLDIPLVRILPGEHEWCELIISNQADVAWFRDFIETRLRLWHGSNTNMSAPNPRQVLTIGLAFPFRSKHDLEHFLPILRRHKCKLDLVIFPEAFESVPRRGMTELNQVVRSNEFAALRDKYERVSKQCETAVIVGISSENESDPEGDQYCFFVSPDGYKAVYHKHSSSLFNAFFDNDWSTERNFPVVEVKGVKVGLSICHDSYISLIPRVLKANGTAVWVNISFSNVVSRKWEAILQARASENEIISVCTLYRKAHRKKGDGRPQKEPYAFSEAGKIRLRDLGTNQYIENVPFAKRTGRIFYFDTSNYDIYQEEQLAPRGLAKDANRLWISRGRKQSLNLKPDDGSFVVKRLCLETFVRFPEKIWKLALDEPDRVPLFAVLVKDKKEWDNYWPQIAKVIRARVIEFSTLFAFVDKRTTAIYMAAYQSSGYKDARICYPEGSTISFDRRYLRGLDSTYDISLHDGRNRDSSIYFDRVRQLVELLARAD